MPTASSIACVAITEATSNRTASDAARIKGRKSILSLRYGPLRVYGNYEPRVLCDRVGHTCLDSLLLAPDLVGDRMKQIGRSRGDD